MPVGAAIAASSVVSAGAGLIASKKAADTQATAATEAAAYQLQAAREAAALQLGFFNTTRNDLAPYREMGTTALPGYMALLGFGPPAAGGGAPAAGAPGSAPAAGGALPAGFTATNGGVIGPDGVRYQTKGMGSGSAPAGYYFGPTDQLLRIPGYPTPPPAGAPSGSGNLIIPGLNGPVSNAPMRAGDFNWAQVLKDRPDVMAEYNKVMAVADKNSPWFKEHGLDRGPEGFAEWWYQNNRPQGDVYSAPKWTQAEIDALYPPSSGGGSSGPAPSPSSGPAAGFDSAGMQAYLENLPGYKFVRDQGIKSVTNSLSTKGLGGISGPMAKGIARFVTGLADTTYGSQLDRISRAVTGGQNAAAQTGQFGAAAAQGAASSIVGGANAQAAGITGAANAGAAGIVGAANAVGGAATGLADAYLTSRILGGTGGGSAGGGLYSGQTSI